MKAISVEITKVIVMTVEAVDYTDAIQAIKIVDADGECGEFWSRAEPQYKLLDIAEVAA